jgi:lipopolysaccharide/colanic/teichoic acid biosynthesis glycosyltransferase/GT2 family glycosyltransferase
VISIVVPAYNAADTLGICLCALNQQTVPREQYEVIVVDDGSTDGTASIAEVAGARVIRQTNRGTAAARNAGVEAARGALILFTDADCEPAPDWIERMAEALRDPGVVGAKGVYRTRQQELVAHFVQLEYEDKYTRLVGQERIDFIDTYSAAYRRDVLRANDGFDEVFPFLEDQELSFRIAQRGYKLVFQPHAAVFHRHADTVAQYFRKKFIIGFWKAQVARRYPEKTFRDSHTPPVMKVQIALIGLSGLLLVGTWLNPTFGWAAFAVFLAMLATTTPFSLRALRRDPAVGLAAPGLLTMRALALGLGYAWGSVSHPPGIVGRQPVISGFRWWVKRTMDIFGALAGLILTAPLMAVLAVLIKLDSPGAVFFKQTRIGENGRPFRIIKLRSMVNGAEARLSEVVDVEQLESPAFKVKNDPRVTRIGRFLRRTSLDELPQFWNVLTGDMSLVGPRPEEDYIVQKYDDWHRKRLVVKPGLTGPMQVNGRGDLPLDERVRLELDYIQNYSLWRDVVILARTLPAWISGKGAY